MREISFRTRLSWSLGSESVCDDALKAGETGTDGDESCVHEITMWGEGDIGIDEEGDANSPLPPSLLLSEHRLPRRCCSALPVCVLLLHRQPAALRWHPVAAMPLHCLIVRAPSREFGQGLQNCLLAATRQSYSNCPLSASEESRLWHVGIAESEDRAVR